VSIGIGIINPKEKNPQSKITNDNEAISHERFDGATKENSRMIGAKGWPSQ